MPFRGQLLKNEAGPSGPTSSTLIHGFAPCLPGRRPSSAVHHFGSVVLSEHEDGDKGGGSEARGPSRRCRSTDEQ